MPRNGGGLICFVLFIFFSNALWKSDFLYLDTKFEIKLLPGKVAHDDQNSSINYKDSLTLLSTEDSIFFSYREDNIDLALTGTL